MGKTIMALVVVVAAAGFLAGCGEKPAPATSPGTEIEKKAQEAAADAQKKAEAAKAEAEKAAKK